MKDQELKVKLNKTYQAGRRDGALEALIEVAIEEDKNKEEAIYRKAAIATLKKFQQLQMLPISLFDKAVRRYICYLMKTYNITDQDLA